MAPHIARRAPKRSPFAAAIGFGALVLLTIGPVSAATVTVAAVNFRFEPETRTVNVGDVVRWTFAGDPHTVTSGAPGTPDGRFDSGVRDPGGSFQVTFDSPGTFRYFCQIHPEQMFGTIVVNGGTQPTPTAQPTPKPTPKPTLKPTPKPTARPTASPTARPTATPTAAPTAAATASPSEAATPSPTAVAPTSAPTPSPSASAPATPTTSATESATPEASQAPNPGDAVVGLDPVPIIALGIVVGLLVAGGVTLLRRSPRT